MKLLHMNSSLSAAAPTTAGREGGVFGLVATALDVPFIQQDRRWCANCAGEQTIVLVDRFPFGWRGYCLGCEEVKFLVDERSTSEVA